MKLNFFRESCKSVFFVVTIFLSLLWKVLFILFCFLCENYYLINWFELSIKTNEQLMTQIAF